MAASGSSLPPWWMPCGGVATQRMKCRSMSPATRSVSPWHVAVWAAHHAHDGVAAAPLAEPPAKGASLRLWFIGCARVPLRLSSKLRADCVRPLSAEGQRRFTAVCAAGVTAPRVALAVRPDRNRRCDVVLTLTLLMQPHSSSGSGTGWVPAACGPTRVGAANCKARLHHSVPWRAFGTSLSRAVVGQNLDLITLLTCLSPTLATGQTEPVRLRPEHGVRSNVLMSPITRNPRPRLPDVPDGPHPRCPTARG